MCRAGAGFSFFRDFGELGQHHEHGPEQDNDAQHQVRRHHPHGLVLQVGVVSSGGLERRDLRRIVLNPRKNEDGSDQHPGDRTERVECLREVQSPLGSPRVAQHGDERIRAGLQKAQPAGDHEQSEEEQAVVPDHGRGPEQQCARAVQQQTRHQPRLVAEPAHDQGGRHRQKEVPHVERRLDQPGLKTAHLERFHELLDQDIVQVVGNAPKKEQCRDQHEGQSIPGGKQSRLVVRLRSWRHVSESSLSGRL